ncbi:MAG: hypothetical protein GY841_10410 [FCB group bacterium]|nr:hypothetical protein [FCB group bacterium]
MPDVRLELTGWEELAKKAGPELFREPMRAMLRKAGSWALNTTRSKTPKDLYTLATSFTLQVDRSPMPGWAAVYSNAGHARPIEYGTGLLSDAPDSKKRRYFPPGPALQGWAERHGFEDGWDVARAIYRRGGTRKHSMLRDAFAELGGRMNKYMAEMAREVQKLWGR